MRRESAEVGRQLRVSISANLVNWSFHLVGDLHQPLHAAALFSLERFNEGDRGGNSIDVGDDRSLHSNWDAALGGDGTSLSSLEFRVGKYLGNSTLRNAGEVARKSLQPSAWMDESFNLAKDNAYDDDVREAVLDVGDDDSVNPEFTPDGDYLSMARKAADERSVQAGYRLAALLSQFFK